MGMTKVQIRATTRRWLLSRSGLMLGVIVLLGLGLRIFLLGRTSAEMNSDEYYTGLQAMAILEGDRPIIYRGIGYTAVIDSYLLAPIYWFADAPITVLKLFNAPWWALTAIVTSFTVRRSIANTIVLVHSPSSLVPSCGSHQGHFMIVSPAHGRPTDCFCSASQSLNMSLFVNRNCRHRPPMELCPRRISWVHLLLAPHDTHRVCADAHRHNTSSTARNSQLLDSGRYRRSRHQSRLSRVEHQKHWLSLAVTTSQRNIPRATPRIFTELIPRGIGVMDSTDRGHLAHSQFDLSRSARLRRCRWSHVVTHVAGAE
jgi:hypothetical protein